MEKAGEHHGADDQQSFESSHSFLQVHPRRSSSRLQSNEFDDSVLRGSFSNQGVREMTESGIGRWYVRYKDILFLAAILNRSLFKVLPPALRR